MIKKHIIFLLVSAALMSQGLAVLARGSGEGRISGQYIVVLKGGVTDIDAVAGELENRHNGKRLNTYRHALKGFSAEMSAADVEKLKKDPRVDFVSQDREVNISGRGAVSQPPQTVTAGIRRISADSSVAKGAGMTVAVIDTGIDPKHPDLAGNILNSGVSCIRRTSSSDDNGHGTHVAGTIAALDNGIGVIGVAPQAKLIPVKVLDRNGSGTWSSIICGLDWVTANASRYNIKVANMSLGGGGTSDNNCGNSNGDALHQAICRSRDAGVTFVVAAGNSGADAGNSVPSAYDDAVITVSALADSDGLSGGLGAATGYGPDDTFATFSNFGGVVDIAAPGVNIFSTLKGGSYATMSGTSMASPHVAGAAALYLNNYPGSTWTQVRDGLRAMGEALGFGHFDPSGLHNEPVLRVSSL